MARLKRQYGITPDDYDRLLKEQGGKCGVCGCADPPKRQGNATHWHVDHCHETGNVRGILCYRCNSGLGNFKDNVDSLQAAIAYLKRTAK